jgi:hypothetical protein
MAQSLDLGQVSQSHRTPTSRSCLPDAKGNAYSTLLSKFSPSTRSGMSSSSSPFSAFCMFW